jgi:hypothetical protein
MAFFQSWAAEPQFAVMFRKPSQISLVAASSVGECPGVFMILRNWPLILSIAFVVWITFRMALGNTKIGTTRSQARRQAAKTRFQMHPGPVRLSLR